MATQYVVIGLERSDYVNVLCGFLGKAVGIPYPVLARNAPSELSQLMHDVMTLIFTVSYGLSFVEGWASCKAPCRAGRSMFSFHSVRGYNVASPGQRRDTKGCSVFTAAWGSCATDLCRENRTKVPPHSVWFSHSDRGNAGGHW